LAINSISISIIIGSLLKKKEKEIEIAKKIFRKRVRAKKKAILYKRLKEYYSKK
jgi:hypothetical protein